MGYRLLAAATLTLFATSTVPQTYQAPRHGGGTPPIFVATSAQEIMARADAGMQIERDRSPVGELAEHRKLNQALSTLARQRPGVVDAYVVSIALDSDPVFGREARAAGDVLRRRYGAAERTLVLAGTDGSAPSTLPRGTPATLSIALARIAELMDEKEDALIVYTTSHGTRFGLFYHDADSGSGAVSPVRMRAMLDQLGIGNRLLILSACYSGIFVPVLQSDTSAVVTAASSERTSFGCAAENDWTFFGDAMINHSLRKPQPLAAAFAEAQTLVSGWEGRVGATPSQPQISIGTATARWLGALEAQIPKTATHPVGRPAFTPPARAASGN